jgi:hypothetical protein
MPQIPKSASPFNRNDGYNQNETVADHRDRSPAAELNQQPGKALTNCWTYTASAKTEDSADRNSIKFNGQDHRARTTIIASKHARKPGFACIRLLSDDCLAISPDYFV